MARKPTKPAVDARSMSQQSIADDIAQFRKRGGRIEVLGNTPLRSKPATAFHSRPDQRKPPALIKSVTSR